MVRFSKDADILKYEPALFGELYLANQILASGMSGVLAGTSFTDSGADFESAGLESSGVIYLRSGDNSIDGAYEIVSVDSATQLTVSVLRANSDDDAIGIGSATDLFYRVSTFAAQAEEAGFQLTECLGILPGNSASSLEAADVLDVDVLRQASVFVVLSVVYAMLANETSNENFWRKSMHYQKLFEKARRRCRLAIDSDGDGIAELNISGGSIRLVRD